MFPREVVEQRFEQRREVRRWRTALAGLNEKRFETRLVGARMREGTETRREEIDHQVAVDRSLEVRVPIGDRHVDERHSRRPRLRVAGEVRLGAIPGRAREPQVVDHPDLEQVPQRVVGGVVPVAAVRPLWRHRL